METTGLLDPFPLWSILPLTIVIGLASFEFGYRLAHYRQQQHQEEKETPVGGMVAGEGRRGGAKIGSAAGAALGAGRCRHGERSFANQQAMIDLSKSMK